MIYKENKKLKYLIVDIIIHKKNDIANRKCINKTSNHSTFLLIVNKFENKDTNIFTKSLYTKNKGVIIGCSRVNFLTTNTTHQIKSNKYL